MIIAATLAHNSITIVAKHRFKVGSRQYEGAALFSFLRLEAEKWERSYPLEQHYEVGEPSTIFATGSKGAKGAAPPPQPPPSPSTHGTARHESTLLEEQFEVLKELYEAGWGAGSLGHVSAINA